MKTLADGLMSTDGESTGPSPEAARTDSNGVPLDPETGRPYYEAALERQFAAADAERARRERLVRLRKLGRPVARRRSFPLDIGDQVGASPPLSTRLPRWLDEQIRQEFEALGVTHSNGVRQILEEWWVCRRYPALEFRGSDFIRCASIRGGTSITEWAESDPRPDLPADIEEQVLDYLQLFRNRCARSGRAGRAR